MFIVVTCPHCEKDHEVEVFLATRQDRETFPLIDTVVRSGTVEIYLDRHMVVDNKKVVHLTMKELSLIECLAAKANYPVTKRGIAMAMYDDMYDVAYGKNITVVVSRLRKLLPSIKIENVRSMGYRLITDG